MLSRALPLLMMLLVAPVLAHAQAPAPPPQRLVLPTVTVTAQKEPADRQSVPVSVTAVPAETLWNAGITLVGEAAIYSPNTWFNEFSARKLSNVFIRGVGSSPGNPGVTTYIDGVPQLHANSSNIEFTGVEQVEFVRGPQSALFGRNTLGGVINVASERPSLSAWTGNLQVPLGSFDTREVRASASGPVAGRVAIGVSAGHSARAGFTINEMTGHDLDSRSASFGKAQVLWTPTATWETRVIVSGERARDGDYALGDLEMLRSRPFRVSRDFEGYTSRDIFNTTITSRREGGRIALTTATGLVRWNTDDETDLDYSPLPAATRSNVEENFQFTQEVRVASAAAAPLPITPNTVLRWQAGVLVFTQAYEQHAINRLAPFVLSPLVPFGVEQHSPRAALDDRGVGLYGQGTFTVRTVLDLTIGARFDHERKEAALDTFFIPAIAPGVSVATDASFSNVSPQVAAAYRMAADRMLYVSAGRGFKAGGFNPASPAGREAYGEEHTWNLETGIKTTWAGGRVSANAALYFIDWTGLQLNLPSPLVPAQFYIANVGGASSRGVELEINARALPGLDLFGALGTTSARFDEGTFSSGRNVSGNDVPHTPDYNVTFGAQVSRALTGGINLYGRGELTSYGRFYYDDSNSAFQGAYSLANFRAGLRGGRLFGELWVKNAFDTHYVPLAFPFPGFAPSGFLGESGRPRIVGVSAGVSF
jgi:iron complex outermembrane recepter protein